MTQKLFSMPDGKRRPAVPAEPADEESADFSFVPSEEAYVIRPTAARRTLVPEDVAYNSRVGNLFQRAIPGLPIDADPPELRRPEQPMATLVEKAIRKLKLNANPWLDDLAGAWPKLVGPAVAAKAHPERWENGILYIGVETSEALFELRRGAQRKMEQAIRAFPGGERVRQVRLMLARVPVVVKGESGKTTC